jgi:hypothetical protein
VTPAGATNSIKVWCWADTSDKPELPGMISTDNNLSEGLVGFNTITGDGYRYWGTIRVTSNKSADGAYIEKPKINELSFIITQIISYSTEE